MNPEPFTLRELLWMAESCQGERWAHTSLMIARILEGLGVKRRGGGRPRPADFNPFAASGGGPRGISLTTDNWDFLKSLVKREKGQ